MTPTGKEKLFTQTAGGVYVDVSEHFVPRAEVEQAYADGESNLLADVNTLCDDLDIEALGHEFDAIRNEVQKLRTQLLALENDGMETAAKLGEAEAEVERLKREDQAKTSLIYKHMREEERLEADLAAEHEKVMALSRLLAEEKNARAALEGTGER